MITLATVQQTVQQVEAAVPYVWEISAILSVLVSLTICQHVKKLRWLPGFLCNWKLSKPKKDGTQYKYKKIKSGYLQILATLLTFGLVFACLSQKYDDPTQVSIIALIVSVLQWGIVEIIFKRLEKHNPEAAQVLREGLYIPSEDATMLTTMAAYASGGKVEDKTRIMTEEEKEEITGPKDDS